MAAQPRRDRRHPHGRVETRRAFAVVDEYSDGFFLGYQSVCRCWWVSDIAPTQATAVTLHRVHREDSRALNVAKTMGALP